MLENFYHELQKLAPLENRELLAEIEQKVSIQAKPKGSILLHEGENSTRVLFLLEGLARGFYYNDGVEVTSWILPENNFLFSPSNFFVDKPATETIQLLEKSTVLLMNKSDLQALQIKYPEAAQLTIRVLEKFLIYYDHRVRFLRLSAEERLKRCQEEYPSIISRISIAQLATFLGLSRSSISHMRTKK